MIMNWRERKQGSDPEGDKVLWNTGGLLFILLFVLRADIRAERTDFRSAKVNFWLERVDLRSERADFRHEIPDLSFERPVSRPWSPD